jgi:hypothetical protein
LAIFYHLPLLILQRCRANFASVWRLVTIIQHRAATRPTFDPSWYGCVSILLAAVEVDLTVICACVPVFWPVLQSAGFQIFVTKEVRITSQSRLSSVGDRNDEFHELRDGTNILMSSSGSLRRMRSTQSDSGSEASLHNVTSSYSKSPMDYYGDKFVQSHVDPLRQPIAKQAAMEVSVSANLDPEMPGPKKGVGRGKSFRR